MFLPILHSPSLPVQFIVFHSLPCMLDLKICLNLFGMQMEESLVQYKVHCVVVKVQGRICMCPAKDPTLLQSR